MNIDFCFLKYSYVPSLVAELVDDRMIGGQRLDHLMKDSVSQKVVDTAVLLFSNVGGSPMKVCRSRAPRSVGLFDQIHYNGIVQCTVQS